VGRYISHKKRENKLKRTGNFEHFSNHARRLIIDEGIMPDVTLMEKLNFTPPSWKIWKPKLIEKFSLGKYDGTIKESGKKIQYQITYNKRAKTWNLEACD